MPEAAGLVSYGGLLPHVAISHFPSLSSTHGANTISERYQFIICFTTQSTQFAFDSDPIVCDISSIRGPKHVAEELPNSLSIYFCRLIAFSSSVVISIHTITHNGPQTVYTVAASTATCSSMVLQCSCPRYRFSSHTTELQSAKEISSAATVFHDATVARSGGLSPEGAVSVSKQ